MEFDQLAGRNAYPADESVKMAQIPNLKQRLDLAVKEAEAKLGDAKRARALLDKNPDLEELLNIMQRGRF